MQAIRVCHVMSADLWAGAEVQLATTAAYLVRRPEVRLSAILMNEGRLAGALRRLGVPVSVVDEQRHGPIRILARLTRLLSETDVDIVHTHRYKDTVLGSAAAKLAGVPHVIRTVHGLAEPMKGWARMKFLAYEALERATLRLSASSIIAVSRQTAAALDDSWFERTRIVCIRNGIDVADVRPARAAADVRRALGVGERVPLIGTVGRLSPVKGHTYLLRAARRILREEAGVRFLIVGDGPLRDDLRAEAAELGVADACVFAGDRSDVYDLVAAMDIFALPSLGEGTPMALLEAMALARPVVATAAGGVTDIVKDRVNGLLVRAGDAHALADACLELMRKPGWAQSLGAGAQRLVGQEFSHERSGRELVDLYRVALASRASGQARAWRSASGGGAADWGSY